MAERIDQDWITSPSLQELLRLLNEENGEARIAGGAVRNALLDQPISDVDIATNLVPRDVILRMQAAGHKSVPTGIEHGTVTVVLDGDAYEVTTLRRDIETDGRHAKVLYGTDWVDDARRRDLTINALYLNADGTVYDPLGGMQDVLSQTVRFIDDAETRIREDYLRILRFFRFFAWYGKFRPDAEGLKACTRLKGGLSELSAERIWHELSRLLAAPDPSRAILWMRQTGVLSAVLPETEKWGIDALPGLMEAERQHGWQVDGLLRLMAIIPPMEERILAISDRLKLPNKVKSRLKNWVHVEPLDASLKQDPFNQWLYWQNQTAVTDTLHLAIAKSDAEMKKYLRQLKWLKRWKKPEFPLRGGDLIDLGMEPGPAISEKLLQLEGSWVKGNFTASKDELLSKRP
ncbi:MAG: CCA tRNA nucleotidyltransferase [Rhizobiaceae bacterium]|nr:CCA tRNA nucleotidyltransferase [Rhizobiaceae bacterium]